MQQTIIKKLTTERVNTMHCVNERHYWKAWIARKPERVRTAATEAGAIASVWWHEGLLSFEEAMWMIDGKIVAR